MSENGAACVADVLVTNDLRGNESHGCSNMLREYIRWLRFVFGDLVNCKTDAANLSEIHFRI